MLNGTEILADALGDHLAAGYLRVFSGREPRYAEVIAEAARLVLERIGSSDALYHSGRAYGARRARRPGHPARRAPAPRHHGGGLAPFHPRHPEPRHRLSSAGSAGATSRAPMSSMRTGKTVTPPRGASDAFLSAVARRALEARGARSFRRASLHRCGPPLRGDRAHALPGSGRRRLRRDGHRSRPRARGGPHRPTRRSVLPAQAQRAVPRVRRDRRRTRGSATPTRPTSPTTTRASSGARSSLSSATLSVISSSPSRAGSGSPTSIAMCSRSSIGAGAWARAPDTPEASCFMPPATEGKAGGRRAAWDVEGERNGEAAFGGHRRRRHGRACRRRNPARGRGRRAGLRAGAAVRPHRRRHPDAAELVARAARHRRARHAAADRLRALFASQPGLGHGRDQARAADAGKPLRSAVPVHASRRPARRAPFRPAARDRPPRQEAGRARSAPAGR